MTNYTPIERHGNLWLKRDDLFEYAGIKGGKVRTCLSIIDNAMQGRPAGLVPGTRPGMVVTAGARHSPQMAIVARVAAARGLRCRCHTAAGAITPEWRDALDHGAEVIPHRPGYNSVIVSRAADDAAKTNAIYVPFGMECLEAIESNKEQARWLIKTAGINFARVNRIVVVLGSGMTAAGILHGVAATRAVPVLGVRVGADPTGRLDRWAPRGWRRMLTMVTAPAPYHEPVWAKIDGITLDPIYESKCVPYLEDGDLFWVVGIRPNLE